MKNEAGRRGVGGFRTEEKIGDSHFGYLIEWFLREIWDKNVQWCYLFKDEEHESRNISSSSYEIFSSNTRLFRGKCGVKNSWVHLDMGMKRERARTLEYFITHLHIIMLGEFQTYPEIVRLVQTTPMHLRPCLTKIIHTWLF